MKRLAFLYLLFVLLQPLAGQTGEVELVFEDGSNAALDTLSDGRIVVANTNTPEVAIYSPELELISTWIAPDAGEYINHAQGKMRTFPNDDILLYTTKLLTGGIRSVVLYRVTPSGDLLWTRELDAESNIGLAEGFDDVIVVFSSPTDPSGEYKFWVITATGEVSYTGIVPTAPSEFRTAWIHENTCYLIHQYTPFPNFNNWSLLRQSIQLTDGALSTPDTLDQFSLGEDVSSVFWLFAGRNIPGGHRLGLQFNEAYHLYDFSPSGEIVSTYFRTLPVENRIGKVIPRVGSDRIVQPAYQLYDFSWPPFVRSKLNLTLAENGEPLDLEDISVYPDVNSSFFWEGFPYRDGFIAVSVLQAINAPSPRAYLSRLDADGCLPFGSVTGQVALSPEGNCQIIDTLGLSSWPVVLTSEDGEYLTVTDAEGNFQIPVLPGTYAVTAIPPSSLWAIDCPPDSIVVALNDTSTLAIPITVVDSCADLRVSVNTPLLRRCFPGRYRVNYSNVGTIAGEGVFVEVMLDSAATFVSADPAPDQIDGQLLTFEIGDLPWGETGEINIEFILGCGDSVVLGQTHCTEARIFPLSNCLGPIDLDFAEIRTDGFCTGDSLHFRIENVGSIPTTESLNYVIIEDQVVLMSNPFSLDPGQFVEVTLPATDLTYTLLAEQDPSFPGISNPFTYLEGCGDGVNGFSFGFGNQFPQNDGDPQVDVDCRTNVGAYDPNDKLVFPTGLGPEGLIEPGTPLEYLIRFQNTGTDTAFTVVIRDRIAPELDLTTFQLLGASHSVEISSDLSREIVFTFDDILLPDSSVNLTGSQGFVRFSIAPRSDLSLGTQITNRAAIYFDFNAPIYTNYTLNTLGRGILSNQFEPTAGATDQLPIQVFPNPANEQVTIALPQGLRIVPGSTFTLFDTMGRRVLSTPYTSALGVVRTNLLPKGVYWYNLQLPGVGSWRGRLVVQ